MDELLHVKRQLKMLMIATVTLVIAVIGLLFLAVRQNLYGDTWPDATLGELKVRKLVVVNGDGQPRILMQTKDGGPILGITSGDSGPDMYIGNTDGKLNLMFDDGPKVRALINSDEIGFMNGDSTQLVLHVGNSTPSIVIKAPDSEKGIIIGEGMMQIGDESKKMIRLASITPSIEVKDEAGYATTVGRSTIRHGDNGTSTVTTAATLVGSTKDSATTWPLVKTPPKR